MDDNSEPKKLSQSELVEKFIELDKRKSTEIKKFYEEFDSVVEQMVETFGVGFHFQDAEHTVYLIDKMEWKAIKMTPFEVKRTRREGETKGSLSMSAGRELGYVVEGK